MNQLTSRLDNGVKQRLIDDALSLAIREDLGEEVGDITTKAIVDPELEVTGTVLLKQEAVVAGLGIFAQVLKRFDDKISVTPRVGDGQLVDSPPFVIATFKGPAGPILSGERLALNLLQRMSGIATVTKDFVTRAKIYGITIRDTRKTTPGLRVFEKEAVVLGGGENHRFGLYDSILIKDNHIAIAGDIGKAIARAQTAYPGRAIEVEACTVEQVKVAVQSGVSAILLDNMTPEQVRQSINAIARKCFVEVSGGINAQNVKNYFMDGVNAISIGALTHSAPNIDISLEVEKWS